jgi:DNA mismatch endonuclease (patch repair protein)
VVDILTPEQRQRCMSQVGSKNTTPEILVRRLLHALGYRFRLHRKDLPGTPDIVIPKLKSVILVHGCFWHSHRGCHRASRPETNVQFWKSKLDANIRRDRTVRHRLRKLGWRILVVWECQTRNANLERRLRVFLRRHQ